MGSMNLFGLGPQELLVIFFLLLIFFGKDRLPEFAKSIGRSFRELKSGFSTEDEPVEKKSEKKSER